MSNTEVGFPTLVNQRNFLHVVPLQVSDVTSRRDLPSSHCGTAGRPALGGGSLISFGFKRRHFLDKGFKPRIAAQRI
jgi:hypothetical protein